MKTRSLLIAAATVALAGTLALTMILGWEGPIERTLLLGVVAIATLLATLAIVAYGMRGSRQAANERSTRLSNLERRMKALAEREPVVVKPAPSAQDAGKDIRQLRDRIVEVERLVGASDAASVVDVSQLTASLVALARRQGVDISAVLSLEQALEQVRAAALGDRVLEALPYLDAFPNVLQHLTLSEARSLLKGLRRLGYLSYAVPVIESIAERFGNAGDARAAVLYRSELQLYRGEVDLEMEFPALSGPREIDVILHLVGKALPETQSGYTLRTQYTVEAQRRLGIRPVVVAHAGGSDRTLDHTETYEHRGIRYYLLGGPKRGTAPWDEWLRTNVAAFAEVVRLTRPAAIHTHSDFLNAMIAIPVARAYGIPLVNETRGFWEESWLSRVGTAEGWADIQQIEELTGLPDMYRLRVQREAETRSQSDAVVTLARVMRDHIQRTGDGLGLPVPKTSIAPNSVHAEDFPVLAPNETLREELGLKAGGIVIGYISSIVEYEGIDTLVRGMFELEMALVAARAIEATMAHDGSESTAELQTLPADGVSSDASPERADDVAPVDVEALRASGSLHEPVTSPLAALRESLVVTGRAFGSPGEGGSAGADEDVLPEAEGGGQVDAIDSILRSLVEQLRLVHAQEDDGTLREYAEALVASVQPFRSTQVQLMVVGDGVELRSLKNLVVELGMKNVQFTGRVPHERVLDHYGLIDLFVVPRKRAAVTELVTPLKPFEALSTGRPCVFSDVKALAEIAADSGCVELFRADDHHDLAVTIARLLGEPERLAEMSRTGAEWVRNERTWDANALTYLDVYRSLGLELEVPIHADELMRLSDSGIGARTIVQRLASCPTPEPTGWFLLEAKGFSAERIMTEGWRIAKHPAIRFEPGMDWEAAGGENRSWGFHLHAWEFIDPVLQEFSATGDERLLRWMIDVALDWWASVEKTPDESTMAWYDMSLSLRMPRLARLFVAASKSSMSDEAYLLIRPALEHVRRSMQDEAFNAGNNHGFFAAAAALDFALWMSPLPGIDDLQALGDERMRRMLMRQFGADGGHLEHSPDYHRMLLRSFESALQSGLIHDEETASRIRRAARVLGWLVQPDGALVQFGDSPRYDVDANDLTSIDDRTTFMLTDGAAGLPEDEELLVLPQTGYAIVRSPQPQSPGERINSSYLAMQGGFHSRAHKHADDLTFTWFDRGHEILVDAGRFGYIDLLPPDSPERLKGFYYSAPERQYVESTVAHNTVQADGADIERRKRAPFGSALGACGRDESSFVLRGAVDHESYRHARALTLEPGVALKVQDDITPSGDVEEVVAWFNMPGELELIEHDGVLTATFPSGARLRISSDGELVTPVRGQKSPMRGWRSLVDREVLPAWSFGYLARVDGYTTLATTFAFEEGEDA